MGVGKKRNQESLEKEKLKQKESLEKQKESLEKIKNEEINVLNKYLMYRSESLIGSQPNEIHCF